MVDYHNGYCILGLHVAISMCFVGFSMQRAIQFAPFLWLAKESRHCLQRNTAPFEHVTACFVTSAAHGRMQARKCDS